MNTNPPYSHLSRRQFIQRTALTGVVLGFPTIIPSHVLGAAAPSKRINILQIGCGRIGMTMDIPGLLKHPTLARIVAACDVDSKRAALAKKMIEEKYAKDGVGNVTVETSQDYHDFINRADIDAVSISTPDFWHAQPVLEAALAGKDIYVQKPLTLTVAEGRLLCEVVRGKNRILQVGSQQRSGAQFHRAAQIVRNGRIGKVHTVRIGLPTDPSGGKPKELPVPSNLNFDAWLGCTPKTPYIEDGVHPQNGIGRPGWLRLNAYTRGMITGWGSHHVDIAHWGTNLEYSGPLAVEATAQWPGSDSFWNVHGAYHVEMKYPDDVKFLINNKFPNGIRFEGDDGWVWVSRGGAKATASDPVSQQESKSIDASNQEWLTADMSKDKVRLHQSPDCDHHLDWLVAMRERRDATTNVETSHAGCTACNVAWIGMKLGRPLKWNAKTERFDDAEANTFLKLSEREPYGAFFTAKKAGFKHSI